MLIANLAVSLALTASFANARDVFAHYMLSSLDRNSDHAARDISEAQAAGFDALALNVAKPTADWAIDAIDQLFSHAEQSSFRLFFSMDTSGGWQFGDFKALISKYGDSSAYYKGPNGKPFVSSFDNTNVFSPEQWKDFKASQNMYLIPDIDRSENYYTNTDAWLGTWGGIVDGAFSWETAWPAASDSPSNVSIEVDKTVLGSLHKASKAYMIPISPLQYKHWPDLKQHWYRVGESNLPQRLDEVLSLGPSGPDFAEFITWNDAGESHYIGNVWAESIAGAEWISEYADSSTWTHAAWRPLLASFIGAFKSGGTSNSMAPPLGSVATGAMWYRTILKDAGCGSDPLGRPASAGSARDAINWAIVLAPGTNGYTARVTSGGIVVKEKIPLAPGLTYESTPGLVPGAQLVEILNDQGQIVLSARSAIDVRSDSNGICNFNYQVAGFQ